MIRTAVQNPLLPNVETLSLVFTPKELGQLRALAATSDEWQWGRQGGGYHKLDLKPFARYAVYDADRWLQPTIERMASALLGSKRSFQPVRSEQFWANLDAWLIFYPHGTGAPWHLDPAPQGKIHRRLNAVVTEPKCGGDLWLYSKGPAASSIPTAIFDLAENEGIIFEPSEFSHQVETIEGTRLVFSMGALVDR